MFHFHQFQTRMMLAFFLLAAIWAPLSSAQQDAALHPKYNVHFFPLQVENQDLRIAFRDVQPTATSNGKTVLLLHGKNFSGFYWEPTIEFLAQQGYRVIAPDQLGFGASSRPDIHYSFHQMANNTKALLDYLGIQRVYVIAHSMGGMLGVRFALLFPETVEKLVLENPLGLEDYRKLVPYLPLQQQYEAELSQTYEKMRDYQKTYYPGAWKPEYEIYVRDQASVLGTGLRDDLRTARSLRTRRHQPPNAADHRASRSHGRRQNSLAIQLAIRRRTIPRTRPQSSCRHQGLNLGRGSGLRPHTAHPKT